MGIEENKEVVKGFFEAGNNIQGDVNKIQAFINDYLSPNHIHHSPNGETSLEETTKFYHMLFSAFPDLTYKIDDIIAEDDKVVVVATNTATHKSELQGIPPTGNIINFSTVDIFRVVDEKITDEWSFPNLLALMQQLGVIPTN